MRGVRGVAVVTALLLAVGTGAWLLWSSEVSPDAEPAAALPPREAPSPTTSVPAPAPTVSAPRPTGDGEAVGRLVHSRDGSGMAGTVRLRSREGAEWSAVAGPDGQFRITGLPRNTSYDIEATAPGCVAHRIPWIWLGTTGRLEFRGLALGAGIPLEVLAVDAEGAPVRGAEVAVRRAVGAEYLRQGSVERPPEVSATTGPDGRASFPAMAAGWWIVDTTAAGFGFERRGLTLREAEARQPLRVVLSPACALFGRILDDTGKPLAGVALQAIRGNGWWDEDAPRSSAVSGDGGAYRIERLVAGSHLLALRPAPGVVECLGYVEVDGEAPFDIRLTPRSRITGRVEEAETHRPVPGASVEIDLPNQTSSSYRTEARATTDATGEFALGSLPAGDVERISVRAAGYVPFPEARTPPDSVPRELIPGVSRALTVSLRRGASVRGTVRDPGGRVVAGAWVGLVAPGVSPNLFRSETVRSDAEGRYRIEAASPGRSFFQAGAHNLHLPGTPRSFNDAAVLSGPLPACAVEVPESGEVVRDLELVPDCRVEGRFVQRDGSPAAGFRPRLVGARDPDRSSMGYGNPSGPDGAFVIEDLDATPGDYRIAAGGPPGNFGVSEPFRLSESAAVEGLVVTVASPASLSGRVRRSDGRALGPATVRLVRAESEEIRKGGAYKAMNEAVKCETAPDGTFVGEDLVPGKWTPIAAAVGCVENPGETVELGDGEWKSGVDVVLPAAREIAGRVVNGAGVPVPGTRIDAWAPQSSNTPDGAVSAVSAFAEHPTARSDAEGRFVLRGLGAGTCRVAAMAEEYAPWSSDVAAGTSDLAVVLSAGLRIEGVVREKAGGKPVEGIKVRCYGNDGNGPVATSGADGAFRLLGLAEGLHSLDISVDAGAPWAPLAAHRVAAGTKGLVLELQEGLAVSGRCVDAAGRPLDTLHVRIDIMGVQGSSGVKLAADGLFRFDRLPPGPCRITVESSDWSGVGVYLKRIVDCQAGDSDVVVALTRGKSITGRVVKEDGSAPAPELTLESCPAGSRGVVTNYMHNRIQVDGTFCTDPYEEGAAQDLFVQAPGGLCAVLQNVAPGSEGVVLRLEGTTSISGRVAFPEGVATEGTYVMAMPAAGVRRCFYANMKKDGSFVFDALPRGAYRLYARSQFSNLAAVEWETPLTGGETGVVVRTVVGNELRVRVRRADGSPLAESEFPMIDHEFGGLLESLPMYLDGDSFVARGLPAGPVSVRLVSRPHFGKPGVGVLANLVLPCPEQTLTAPR